jgi:hypothetical protein
MAHVGPIQSGRLRLAKAGWSKPKPIALRFVIGGRLHDTFKVSARTEYFHHIDSPDQAGCPQRPRDTRRAVPAWRVSPQQDF